MDDIKKIEAVVQRCSFCKYRFHVKLVFILLFIVSINCSLGIGDDEHTMKMSGQRQNEAAESKMPIIDTVKSLFSLPTASSFWVSKFKELFRQGWPFSSHPNLDFRGDSGGDEGKTAKEGAKEKVKEAVVKTLDKSKAAVEDSAKSAAKFADEAVEKTVKKLKRTLSGKGEERVAADYEAEL